MNLYEFLTFLLWAVYLSGVVHYEHESSLFMTQLAGKETIFNNSKLIENSFLQIIHIDLISLFSQITSPTSIYAHAQSHF